jgi:altronate hydrolase
MKQKAVRIQAADNVAVALTRIVAGEESLGVVLAEDVAQGHKFALRPIAAGENVVKYGFPIGRATVDIQPGAWVHTHNVRTNLDGRVEYAYHPALPSPAEPQDAYFWGYRRADGRYGVRNELWIVNTIGCVNAAAEAIAKEATLRYGDRVDGIYAFPHACGCGQMGDDLGNARRALLALARHPNAGGVLVLGLGCEYIRMEEFKAALGKYDQTRYRFLVAQEVDDEIEEGVRLIGEIVETIALDKRERAHARHLAIGLKCGGSDGLSGLTANPLLGAFSDKLCACGGATLMSEVSEMFGAEGLLMNRCRDEQTFDALVAMINGVKDEYIAAGQVIYENPSPGNKDGGITTLEDKSLGCTQKGGKGSVNGVLSYAVPYREAGLNLVTSPSYDLVSVTSLALAGAQIVLFTTGRGTPYGGPVPTVKIATNSPLAQKKPKWIDFDAGHLVETGDLDGLAEEFFQYILQIASGETCANEKSGYREIAIHKTGVTL